MQLQAYCHVNGVPAMQPLKRLQATFLANQAVPQDILGASWDGTKVVAVVGRYVFKVGGDPSTRVGYFTLAINQASGTKQLNEYGSESDVTGLVIGHRWDGNSVQLTYTSAAGVSAGESTAAEFWIFDEVAR